MKCPKCGFEQPVSLECIRCGIVFSKFAKSQKQALDELAEQSAELSETRPIDVDDTPATFRQDQPAPVRRDTSPLMNPAAAPPTSGTSPGGTPLPTFQTAPTSPNPLDMPIGPALRWVRLAAGLMAITFGSLLFWAGEAVAPEPIEALLLIIYLCVGVFWVLSFTFPTISVRRFSLEMLLFVVVTLGIRLTSPDLFDSGKLTQGLRRPPESAAAAMSTTPEKTSAAQLKQDSWDLNRTTRMLVAGELKDEQQWTDTVSNLKKTFRGLTAEERDRLEPSYRATIDLEKAVAAWRGDPSSENAEKVYSLVETIDTFDW